MFFYEMPPYTARICSCICFFSLSDFSGAVQLDAVTDIF